MGPDSISSYQRDSAQNSYQPPGEAASARQKNDRLPKDVLEALESGNLEEALMRLRAHQAQDAQGGMLQQMMAKLGRLFKFTNPTGQQVQAGAKRSTKKKKETIQPKQAEKVIKEEALQLLARMQQLAMSMASWTKNKTLSLAENSSTASQQLAVQISAKMKQFFMPSAHFFKTKGKAASQHFDAIAGKLLALSTKMALKVKRGVVRVSEKIAQLAKKIADPIQEWTKEKVMPPIETARKWMLRTVESVTHIANQTVQQTWQVVVVLANPFVAAFLQVRTFSEKAALYGIAHLRKAAQKTGQWLQSKGEAVWISFTRVFVPPAKKVISWISSLLNKLLETLAKILIWMWDKIVKILEKIPSLTLAAGKGIWILITVIPKICFAASVGVTKSLAVSIWRSVKF